MNKFEKKATPRSHHWAEGVSMMIGAGAGAGLAYFYDHRRGRSRRAKLVRKAGKLVKRFEDKAGHKAYDLLNRAEGVLAEAVAAAREEEKVSDRVLIDRVRSRAGHLVAHPHNLEVQAHEGVVTLRGTIGRAEHRRLVGVVRGIPGVRRVQDRLRHEGTFATARSLISLAGLLLVGMRAPETPRHRAAA
jgi:BON domain